LKDQAHVPEPEAASPKDPPPNETPPRLVTGTARFDRCIDDQINARPGYHAGMVVATVAGRGKGSEGRTMRGDVALAYNAGARDKPNRVLANVTAAELRRYYRDGWGVLDDDRQGRGLFSILLHTIANTGGNVTGKMTAAWREFAPWLPVTDMAKLADDAINVRRRWRSATLGQRIGLTYADRTRLRITTAWACDKPKADQGRLTKQRAVEAKMTKRRATGIIPRDQYETNGLSQTKPWEAEGICRRTWERRRESAARRVLSQVRPKHKDFVIASVTLATPRPEAPPQGCREGDWSFVGAPSPSGAHHRHPQLG
jgi:hypothetical protein